MGTFKRRAFSFAAEVLGFLNYHLMPRKKVVVILSTMRSGSTLLKALMGEASDITHLPEINFNRPGSKYFYYYLFLRASKKFKQGNKSIIVAKRPSSINDFQTYPNLGGLDVTPIVLVRNPVTTVLSIKKMPREFAREFSEEELLKYWIGTYSRLLEYPFDHAPLIITYEDLTRDPQSATQQIFQYVGSEMAHGVNTYKVPENWSWEWGTDDGSETIKSRKIETRKSDGGKAYDAVSQKLRSMPEWQSMKQKFFNVLQHYPS